MNLIFYPVFIYSDVKFVKKVLILSHKETEQKKEKEFVTGRIHSVGFTRKPVGRQTD